MKRNALVLTISLVFFGLTLMAPTTGTIDVVAPEYYVPYGGAMPAADISNYVDSISNVDASADRGTHSAFADMQAGPDSTFDTLTEANTDPAPTNSHDDYDSNTSDVDSSADKGTESNPTNAQGTTLDSNYMTLQEA
ncbi:MAG: hypothetical protein ACFFAY_06935, partial [Promethearchaeota archaeon]